MGVNRVVRTWMRAALRVTACSLVLVALVATSGCKRKPRPVTSKSFTPSAECRPCHADIYRHWSESLHARAATNSTFTTAHREYLANPWLREGGGPDLCLRCHLPMSAHGDAAVPEQGIGCDYCHSISDVRVEKEQPIFVVTPGDTKFGPVPDAKSPAHQVAFKPLFRESAMCAGCHELVSPAGTPILSTYSEWQKSPAKAAGKHCQHCHMQDIVGNLVDARVRRRPDATINSHRTLGGHSPEQLRKAVSLEIRSLRREGDTVSFDVDVANTGAGHDLPTGVPTRTIVLSAEVVDGATVVGRAERVFMRQVLDAQGRPIRHDSRVFVATAKVGADNRLKAGEKRTEHFVFPKAGSPAAHVRVRLTYAYNPSPGTLPGVAVTFLTMEKRLAGAVP